MLPPFMPKPIKTRGPATSVMRRAAVNVENGLKAPLRVLGCNEAKSDATDPATHSKGTG